MNPLTQDLGNSSLNSGVVTGSLALNYDYFEIVALALGYRSTLGIDSFRSCFPRSSEFFRSLFFKKGSRNSKERVALRFSSSF